MEFAANRNGKAVGLAKAFLVVILVILTTEVNQHVRLFLKGIFYPGAPFWLDHIFFLLTFKVFVFGLVGWSLLSREEMHLRWSSIKGLGLGVITGVLLFLIILPLMSFTGVYMEWTWQPNVPQIIGDLFSDFYEEFLYRGVVLALLIRYLPSPAFAVVVSATLFCYGHLRYELPMLAMTFLVAVLWGWMTLRFKSLLPAYISHSVVDGLGAFLR